MNSFPCGVKVSKLTVSWNLIWCLHTSGFVSDKVVNKYYVQMLLRNIRIFLFKILSINFKLKNIEIISTLLKSI